MMTKSVIITIMIDDVTYSQIEELEEIIQHHISDYPDKRVTINIQDNALIRPERI